MLVEIADGSLEMDRGIRMAAYAIGDIPVFWIINLADRQVEVYSDPVGGQYRDREVFRPGKLVPVAFDGEAAGAIAVANLLP
jgi:Uma2 family endonuclease